VSARVVVTGTGLVTALGTSVPETWGRLVAGERGLLEVTLFDTAGYRSRVGGQVRGVLAADGEGDPSWSRTTAMALTAAREAVREAGLDRVGARAGLVVGGTVGGMFETEGLLARFHADPDARGVLSRMLSHPLTATGDRLERELGPFARARTLSSACSGGANAIVVGATWLVLGLVDVVVAGASDALCRLTWSGFNALGALDPEPCRPFDARRRGLSLGEGAGFVVLERADHARARGAAPIAELAGWAIGSEAHHVTNPEPTGAVPARLFGEALARAGLRPTDVDYVSAHGTGTPLNDPMETRALAAALGDALPRVPVSSSKGQLGHTLGAAGAIEAIVAALAVARGVVPPTGGLETPDPACALRHVTGRGEPHEVRVAMSSSFGFGGMDAVLVLAAPGHAPPPRAMEARRVVVTGSARLGATLPATRMPAIPEGELDPARARRLDRASRVATALASRALRTASHASVPSPARAGIVLGSAFGSVDGSSAFMHRLFEKGPRLVSPAEFPNLVPSASVGHASIYLEQRGPALAVADLAASGEAAIAQGLELVQAGLADQIVAGAAEEASDIVERVLVALFAGGGAAAARSEGAGMVVLEDEGAARASGATILARVAAHGAARGGRISMPAPREPSRARVVAAYADARLGAAVEGTAWEAVTRVAVGPSAGDHEALGAIAACVAVELVTGGDADEVLVLCADPQRGYALVLARP
jgi:3-oxoacyl-[acyl-carrier-protein] synthase II